MNDLNLIIPLVYPYLHPKDSFVLAKSINDPILDRIAKYKTCQNPWCCQPDFFVDDSQVDYLNFIINNIFYSSLYFGTISCCFFSFSIGAVIVAIDKIQAFLYFQEPRIENDKIIKNIEFCIKVHFLFWYNYRKFMCIGDCDKTKNNWLLLLYLIALDRSASKKIDWDYNKDQKDLLDNALRHYVNSDRLQTHFHHS